MGGRLWVPGETVAAGDGWGEVGDGKPLGMSLFQSFEVAPGFQGGSLSQADVQGAV